MQSSLCNFSQLQDRERDQVRDRVDKKVKRVDADDLPQRREWNFL
jgi:hypothetical protein